MKGVSMKKLLPLVFVIASLGLLAGCPGKPPEQPPPPPAQTTDTSAVDDANATTDETATQGPSGELLSKRIVYFDFDSADIRGDSQSVVAAHARYLAGAAAQKVRRSEEH